MTRSQKFFWILAFLLVTVCILTHSGLSLKYARNGLELWFNSMVPTLLPFMILSGTLIRMGLTDGFVMLIYPFVRLVFRVSKSACYVIIMGFMCGFPMGAKCVNDMYSLGKISDDEAAWLLAFCNNIGPVYFVSFALPLLGCKNLWPCIFGMYGLPVLYGLFLRYTVFRNINIKNCSNTQEQLTASKSFFTALNESVYVSLQSIFMLGGYMILFNLLMLLPGLFLTKSTCYIAPILEITGGLKLLGNNNPFYSMLMLSFGGLSCIAQTYSCISHTPTPIGEYVRHKLILTALTGIYYLLCLRFLRLW
ncbi:MAG: hypothetical protein E7292_02745 [Lachnospiraceae bacterium]|nr:hypothetical protein [Lachnospiraceae bacterium]